MDITLTNETIDVEVVNEELAAELTNETIDVELSNDSIYYYLGMHLEINFTYEDWLAGSKKIGTALAGLRIERCQVLIDPEETNDIFDEGTIVIGDAGAHGRIMIAADVNLTKAKKFSVEPDIKYTEDTDLYIYFETGSPTQGSGTIIIYLQ